MSELIKNELELGIANKLREVAEDKYFYSFDWDEHTKDEILNEIIENFKEEITYLAKGLKKFMEKKFEEEGEKF